MSVGGFLLLASLLGGGVVMVGLRFLYPAPLNEWRVTFDKEHRDPRRTLRNARWRRRAVRRIQRQQVTEAEKNIKRVGKTWRRRTRKLERRRDGALWEGRGGPLCGMGRLHLYEHELVVLRTDPGDGDEAPDEVDVIRLADLTVRHGSVPGHGSYIEILEQRRRPYAVDFPSRYDQLEVRDLYLAITGQITEDQDHRDRQRAEADALTADIRAAEAQRDRDVTAAQDALKTLLRAQATDPQLIQADDAWNTACDGWEALTGRRPRWWDRR